MLYTAPLSYLDLIGPNCLISLCIWRTSPIRGSLGTTTQNGLTDCARSSFCREMKREKLEERSLHSATDMRPTFLTLNMVCSTELTSLWPTSI